MPIGSKSNGRPRSVGGGGGGASALLSLSLPHPPHPSPLLPLPHPPPTPPPSLMRCLSLLLLLSAALAEEPLGTVIGIDLGTTYSCVAVYKNGRVEILANEQGHRVTPSWVGFTDGGERLVGDGAKAQASLNPAGTLYDAKRLIGRSFADEAIQADIPFWPFKVIADSRGKPLLQLEVAGKKRTLTPQEVSAMVLGKMRETAEAFLGEQVSRYSEERRRGRGRGARALRAWVGQRRQEKRDGAQWRSTIGKRLRRELRCRAGGCRMILVPSGSHAAPFCPVVSPRAKA